MKRLGIFQISRTYLLRALHVLNHVAFLYGLYWYNPSWLLLSVFCWFLFGCFGISIGFHRLLSHRSFETTKFGMKAMSLLGCLATGGSPVSWVGAHRLHHTFPDKTGDPHSWKVSGKFNVYFHFWPTFAIRRKHIRDLLKDPYQKFLHRNYFLIIFSYAGFLYLISPIAGIFAYSIPAVFAFHAFGLINTFGHGHGYRNFDVNDLSTNSWVANLLTWGEGWHNNHHRYPSYYRIGLKPNEVDISAWVIEHIPFVVKNRNRLNKDRFKSLRSQ